MFLFLNFWKVKIGDLSMGRIEQLSDRYSRHIRLPWQKDLAGAQKGIFVIYQPTDERRLRNRKELFEMETKKAGHGWKECDLTRTFAEWISNVNYRESYFASPEDLALKLDEEFVDFVAEKVRKVLQDPDTNDSTVVAVFGIASLFGFARVSELMSEIEKDIKGRVVVFFPGEFDQNNYRLMDARDSWNYLAVPITLHDEINGK